MAYVGDMRIWILQWSMMRPREPIIIGEEYGRFTNWAYSIDHKNRVSLDNLFNRRGTFEIST